MVSQLRKVKRQPGGLPNSQVQQPSACRRFEDVIAPDFDAFGHRLTNSTATAIAINSAAGSLGSFIFAIPGGFIGDRLGRHAVLLSTGYATCVFPLINAFRPTYPWVLFCSVAGGVTSGISAGAASALNADCVPCDADGKPLNAGRDAMLLAAFTQLSSAVVPPLLGHAFVRAVTMSLSSG